MNVMGDPDSNIKEFPNTERDRNGANKKQGINHLPQPIAYTSIHNGTFQEN